MLTLSDSPLSGWTPIARRRRLSEDGQWSEIPGAPLTLAEANQLRAEGVLTQALQYDLAHVTVVVRRRGPKPV